MHLRGWRTVAIVVVSVVLAGLLVSTGFLGRMLLEPRLAARSAGTAGDLDPALITQIIDILHQDFVDPTKTQPDNLFDGAIEGVFARLGDSHSTYVTPRDYALTRNDFSGGFQGIGATVSKQTNDAYVSITQTLPGTPAEKAGLKAGDQILAVNGEPAENWTVDQAALKIRGPRGSTVEIRIRHTDKTEQTYKIERDDVLVASVDTVPPFGTLVDASGQPATDIAYMRIRSFTSRTPQELQDQIKAAEARGAKGIILDVRSNPGGLLQETAQIADFFLDGGRIVTQVDRAGNQQSLDAKAGHLTDLPVVIVQDQDSASGSEVLAAALHDNGRAKVVGTRSFGKGTVNHYRELSNGGAVYVSIARWLTPKGQQIEGQGVQPDVNVEPTDEDIQQRHDTPVYRAIDLLRGLPVPAGTPVPTPSPAASATATRAP